MPSRVVLAGAAGAMPGLAAGLTAAGLQVEETPLLSFAPPDSWTPLDRALLRLERYAALAVTSPRGARAVLQRAVALNLSPGQSLPVFAPASSAELLRRLFQNVRVVTTDAHPAPGLALQLASALRRSGVGGPVLFPCAEVHREELVISLRASGRRVEPVVVYRTLLADDDLARAVLARADLIVVTSPRVVELLARLRPADATTVLVVIGPTTERTARMAGWAPDAVAARPTAEAVLGAITQLLPSTP